MYDLVIKNGRIIDGTGGDSYLADVAVSDGKIVKIGQNIERGKKVIDAKGLVVTPGFIDSHSHSDENIFTYPEHIEKVEQGITTSITGQCGLSLLPKRKEGSGVSLTDRYETVGALLDKRGEIEQGSNIALYIGHSQLRKAVMGMEIREPNKEELEEMKALIRDAIESGAVGLSFGLIYTPSCYSKTEELVELAKTAAECGGMISAHVRDEADFLEEAIEEYITVIKASGAKAVVSHHKAMYKQNHGKVLKTLEMIRRANAEGADIYCDVYPYVASATTLEARFIPSEYRKGGDKVVEFLNNPEICKEIKDMNLKKWGDDLSWVLINTCKGYKEYEGKTLDEISNLHGKDVYETIFDILRDSDGTASASYFSMSEADVETVMSFDRAMICTDSEAAGARLVYHPRLRGSFPRVLGRYVRERNVTSLEEMIRKMTSLPADVYSLKNKGLIREGYDADICIFDPEKIIDHADFTDCSKRAEGLNYVIVNGVVAAENAVYNGSMSGRILVRGDK